MASCGQKKFRKRGEGKGNGILIGKNRSQAWDISVPETAPASLRPIVAIFWHGHMDRVPYGGRQGLPDTCQLHACAWTADKSQVEKVWRRKNEGSPPPADMN